jgi:hypothetical protein
VRVGSIRYNFQSTSDKPGYWHTYLVFVSGAGESKRLLGYAVGSAMPLNDDTPSLNPVHLLLEAASVEEMTAQLLRRLRELPANGGGTEVVDLEDRDPVTET